MVAHRMVSAWAGLRTFDGHLSPLRGCFVGITGRVQGAGTMKHVAPLGWEHLSFTGDYAWETGDLPGPGQLRPLRTKSSLLTA